MRLLATSHVTGALRRAAALTAHFETSIPASPSVPGSGLAAVKRREAFEVVPLPAPGIDDVERAIFRRRHALPRRIEE